VGLEPYLVHKIYFVSMFWYPRLSGHSISFFICMIPWPYVDSTVEVRNYLRGFTTGTITAASIVTTSFTSGLLKWLQWVN